MTTIAPVLRKIPRFVVPAVALVIVVTFTALITSRIVETVEDRHPVVAQQLPQTKPFVDTNGFVTATRSDLPELAAVPDKNLIEVATSTCTLFAAGGTMNDVFDSYSGSKFNFDEIMDVTLNATDYMCPKYSTVVTG